MVPRQLPPILCPRCCGPILAGQMVPPLFAAKLTKWAEHPVLSKPIRIRGIVTKDGSPGRSDLSIGDQLRERAAMGGERERAQLEEYEKLLAQAVVEAAISLLKKEAEEQALGEPTASANDTSERDRSEEPFRSVFRCRQW